MPLLTMIKKLVSELQAIYIIGAKIEPMPFKDPTDTDEEDLDEDEFDEDFDDGE
jgi:hypothetical protein